MKKITLLILFVLPFTAMAQFISNSTFTLNGDGGATGITDWVSGTTGAIIAHDNTVGNDAVGSLQLTTDDLDASKAHFNGIAINTTGDYTVTFYVKGVAGDQFRAQIWQSGASGTTSAYQTISSTDVWQEYSHTVTLTAGAGNASARLWGEEGEKIFHFDDVYLTYNAPESFDYSFDFETDGDFEGWNVTNATGTVASGSLNMNITTSSNPKIALDPLYYTIPADTYNVVEVTLTNSSSNEWLRIAHPKASDNTKTLYTGTYIAPNNASPQTYRFNLKDNDGWTGNVSNVQVLVRGEGNSNASSGDVVIHSIKFIEEPTEMHVYEFNDVTTEGWQMIASNGYVSDVTGGSLTYNPQADKFAKIILGGHYVNTNSVDAIRIQLTNYSTSDDQIKISIANGGSTVVDINNSSESVGEETVEIPLVGVSGWTGNLSQLSILFLDSARGDGKSAGGGLFEINRIEFYQTPTAGLETIEKGKIAIYPNPVNDILNVSVETANIVVYDILGQPIVSVSNVNSLNTSNLKSGSYIARITTQEGEIVTKRFFKK
ncbi:T9SS type A sorting domain-containing protein [Flavicella sp.]|uniref:T9SS type A sorting domain-containing protein n=1 Tax=Flavicella sp. TaxID=2957742 RepID=UPI00262BF596|nr:T9SS type A sorting domain-containing protein [Flavicella sp.]MDG1805606.1 T9SS type A sorting domain-containing protein [Flavicella sp.]MDG2279719.1 T9SS type A sorting domain-containing protein [Flavicella sp.]